MAGQVFDGPAADHKTLDFAIRPEDQRATDVGLTLKVRVVEPLRADLLVTGEVDGHLFHAVLDSDLEVDRGDELPLASLADRVRWFDPDTTRSVA